MRTTLIALVLAMAAGGCATVAGEQQPASHDAAAHADKKPMKCGMHAARAAESAPSASSAASHDKMKHHCAHMQTGSRPVKQ